MTYRVKKIKSLAKPEVEDKLRRIRQTFVGIPLVKGKANYDYVQFTLTDYKPAMKPELIEDMADLIVYYGNFDQADLIVSEADRGGGPLTHAVALRVGLPYTLANWYPKETPGEIVVTASAGFAGDGLICINGIQRGAKVIVVDDLLSTGGTILALLQAIEKGGAQPLEVLSVAEKLGYGGREKINKLYQLPITTLVQFAVDGDKTNAV